MKLFVISLIIFASNTFALQNDCYRRLTDNFKLDSISFNLGFDDVVYRDFGNDHLADAIYNIKELLKKKGCNKEDINFGRGSWGRSVSKCHIIVPNKENSRVCYVETNLGFFMVSKDMIDNINITYSRWD